MVVGPFGLTTLATVDVRWQIESRVRNNVPQENALIFEIGLLEFLYNTVYTLSQRKPLCRKRISIRRPFVTDGLTDTQTNTRP